MALIGRSGCGKSTLLDLACGIRTPQKGMVEFEARNLAEIGDESRRLLRLESVGLVFQEFRLLEYLTVLDSILLPIRLSGRAVTSDIRDRAHELARRAGIQALLKRRPQRLSQGERQRAAICRALIGNPRLVLADEPTGNLDPATAESVLDLLFEQVAEAQAALLVITHDHEILHRFDEVFDLSERNLAGAQAEAGAG
jgi:putative ABC transport system ATP-binding protein